MKKALLILDLDETLIHATTTPLENQTAFCVVFDEYHIYIRPYLKAFLDETQKHFDLAIWSSASDDYVHEVAKNTILSEYKLQFIWGRSRATYRRNLEQDDLSIVGSDSHYHYVKSLKKVKKMGYPIERILIVDDSPHKSKMNFGNAIYPNSFEGDLADNDLELLSRYLISIKDQENFRKLEKRGWRAKV